MAVNNHLAFRSAQISCHNIHCGGFSRPIRPQKTIDLPGFQSEVQVVYSKMVPVFFHQISHFYQNRALPKRFFTPNRVTIFCERSVLEM